MLSSNLNCNYTRGALTVSKLGNFNKYKFTDL